MAQNMSQGGGANPSQHLPSIASALEEQMDSFIEEDEKLLDKYYNFGSEDEEDMEEETDLPNLPESPESPPPSEYSADSEDDIAMSDDESDINKKQFGSMEYLNELSTGPASQFKPQASSAPPRINIEDEAAIALK